MDEYGGDIESTGVAYNWSQLPKAFEALGRDHDWKRVRKNAMVKIITLARDDVYVVEIEKVLGNDLKITVMKFFGEENEPLVEFKGGRARLRPGYDSEVDISNMDMPQRALELFKRILTYPEIAIVEQDESGSADMAKRMAKKIGWRVDAGGYVM